MLTTRPPKPSVICERRKNIVQPERPQMTIWCMHISRKYLRQPTQTLGICYDYCFSTATMFARTRHNVTLYVHCLSSFLRSWDRASLIYSSITNKMQRYTMVFITIKALHVSGGSFAHNQELKIVYTASGICRAFSGSYRSREWVNSLTIAVRSRKSSTNTGLCIQFWAPDDARRNRLKHIERL